MRNEEQEEQETVKAHLRGLKPAVCCGLVVAGTVDVDGGEVSGRAS